MALSVNTPCQFRAQGDNVIVEHLGKLLSTGFIWVLCAGIAITALITSQYNYNDSGFLTIMYTAIPLLSALAATFMIWVAPELARRGGNDVRQRTREDDSTSYKSKRNVANGESARLAALMDMMDEDERAAFKASLKRRVLAEQRLNDDGEFYGDPATLDSLLRDDYDEKRLRH